MVCTCYELTPLEQSEQRCIYCMLRDAFDIKDELPSTQSINISKDQPIVKRKRRKKNQIDLNQLELTSIVNDAGTDIDITWDSDVES